MGWFDKQLKLREDADTRQLQNVLDEMAGVLTKSVTGDYHPSDQIQSSLQEIFRYYGFRSNQVEFIDSDLNDMIDFALRQTGIMRRNVKLANNWYKDAIGAYLAETNSGETVALVPNMFGRYTYYDFKQGKRITLNRKNSLNFKKEAICFYKPLPQKALGMKALVQFIIGTLSVSDYIFIIAATLSVTLLGLVTPYIYRIIFSDIIESGRPNLLIPAASLLVGAMMATLLMNISKSLIMTRIETKMKIAVEAAAMMRMLTLPVKFFKNYSSGELSSRMGTLNNLCSLLTNTTLSIGLSTVFSLVYILQIFNISPSLVIPSLLILVFTFAVSVISTLKRMKLTKRRMEYGAREGGLIYSLFSAVQKIKLAGAERRTFAKWAKIYTKSAKLNYDPPFFLKINRVLQVAISLLGTLALYTVAAYAKVSVGDYVSFMASYGMVSAGFMSLASMITDIAGIKPTFDMVDPLLKAVPEMDINKKSVKSIKGMVELSNITFRYTENSPYVLQNLTLKIRSGQYVAIVGATGCGKSTIFRLILGFEKPEKGAVYLDGLDLSELDLTSLRKNIGCVIQNGKLFHGSIYSNIVVSAPWLSLEDAWEAAEIAGLADDIREMPMGMHTVISENGGISGGQKQRLMIARAVAAKPRLLMLDEATSALDNITQKKVADALDKLKCTRIVIAHRLSTIKQCDRIILLENGQIAEDGNYEELMEKKGLFARLVARQQVGGSV